MLEARRCGVAAELGFANFYDYAESVLELGGREVYQRVRVAEALEELPILRDALASRQLCFSAVRELCRVCAPETEAAWLGAASGRSVRQVERLVAGHRPGDGPDDPVDPAEVQRAIHLEVSAATQVLWKELRRRVEADVGHRLEDDAFASEVARGALAADSRKPSAPSYQIAVTVCERCEQATQDGAGEVVAIDAAALDRAMCDAEWLELTHVGQATRDVSAATRRAVLARDHHRCRAPGCRSSRFVDLHHLIFRDAGGSHDQANIVTLCGAHHAAVHRGTLIVRGTTSDTARFFHPDGAAFAAPRGPAFAAPS